MPKLQFLVCLWPLLPHHTPNILSVYRTTKLLTFISHYLDLRIVTSLIRATSFPGFSPTRPTLRRAGGREPWEWGCDERWTLLRWPLCISRQSISKRVIIFFMHRWVINLAFVYTRIFSCSLCYCNFFKWNFLTTYLPVVPSHYIAGLKVEKGEQSCLENGMLINTSNLYILCL